MDIVFKFKGNLIKATHSTSLDQLDQGAGGGDFFAGVRFLKYGAGGAIYTITALKRAMADATHYVPRCIEASEDGDLDAINGELLTRRFSRNISTNKCGATACLHGNKHCVGLTCCTGG